MLLLFIYPFLHGLVLSFEPKEGGGLANYLRFFSQPFLYNTIATTLWIAIPTTLVNVGLALPIAFGMRRNSAWQRVLTTILVLPITLGTVLIARGAADLSRAARLGEPAADRERSRLVADPAHP